MAQKQRKTPELMDKRQSKKWFESAQNFGSSNASAPYRDARVSLP